MHSNFPTRPIEHRSRSRLNIVAILLSLSLHLAALIWTLNQPNQPDSAKASKQTTAISAVLISAAPDIQSPAPSSNLKATQQQPKHASVKPAPHPNQVQAQAAPHPNRMHQPSPQARNANPIPMKPMTKRDESDTPTREADPFSGAPSSTASHTNAQPSSHAGGSHLNADLAGLIAREIRSHLTPMVANVRTPVVLELTCQTSTGRVTSARIAKSSGDWRWDDAARQAALASIIPQSQDGTRPQQFAIRVFP